MEFVTKPKSNSSVLDAKGSDAMILSGVVDADQLRSGSLGLEDDRNMLSFSNENKVQNAAFQLCYPQSLYSRSSGDFGVAGTFNSTNMHVPFAGARQLFTQAQWFELEQQALIYKYIAANVSVPSNLIIPIKKSFNPWGLSSPVSANGSLSSSSIGWGPFHLGFPGSTDPEPERCRRTDGKKWRCAKDAVHGHKYCDKHLNRGRHRSRKPVEGQKPDRSVTLATTFPRVGPMSSSLSKASVVVPSGSCANANGMHSNVNPSLDSVANRTLDLQSISVLSPTISSSSKEASFATPKPKDPFEESYQSKFGFVSSDYLQNPCKNYNTSLLNYGVHGQDQHQLRQFFEEWPKDRLEHSSVSWQGETATKPDLTKLSMSIPMASSGFSSSASSPAHERLGMSPLRLGREFHHYDTGLCSGNELSDSTYMPNSPWGSLTGGPLGEVLKTGSSKVHLIEKNPSGLDLMTKGWDSSKTQFEPSPTGVLLKSTFGSASNSSSGGSPRPSDVVGSLCMVAPRAPL